MYFTINIKYIYIEQTIITKIRYTCNTYDSAIRTICLYHITYVIFNNLYILKVYFHLLYNHIIILKHFDN